MRIHVLGACGTFMGGLARLASELGHEVTGSDGGCYEPMAGQLRDAGIECREGHAGGMAGNPADLYLVGNVISRGNPLLEEVLTARAPFMSGPQWLAATVLATNEQVIAVAGTHGKTTTTALVIHMLDKLGWEPGYLVGGEPRSGAPSARLGQGRAFVVEADEYDTAFHDKRPKFTHYWSTVTVLNNVEFDHADIYPDLDSVKRQFSFLPRQVRPGGTVVANWGDGNVREVLGDGPWSWCGLERYNDVAGLRWDGGTLVDGDTRIGEAPELPWGAHNRVNALAALQACRVAGVDLAAALVALDGSSLPRRRLELIHDRDGVLAYDDFAHHPTAIRATLAALRERHPQARLVVAFEPRSNTMKAGAWRDELAGALDAADAVLAYDGEVAWDLAAALTPLGERARTCADARALAQVVADMVRPGDVLALLSNGDFHGLRAALPDALRVAA